MDHFSFCLFVFYLSLTVEENESEDQGGVGQSAVQTGNAEFLHLFCLSWNSVRDI